jgi:hypothetical protein
VATLTPQCEAISLTVGIPFFAIRPLQNWQNPRRDSSKRLLDRVSVFYKYVKKFFQVPPVRSIFGLQQNPVHAGSVYLASTYET